MGYVENNLGKDEEILARAQRTWAGLIGAFLSNAFSAFCWILVIYALTTWLPPLVLEHAASASGDPAKVASALALSDDMGSDSMRSMLKLYDILMLIRNVTIAISIVTACFKTICAGVSIRCNQLIVTNKRLFGRTGVFSRSIIDIVLLKLDTINSKNGLLGAIFHYGTLEVVSAGSQKVMGGNSTNMTFPYVKNTEEFRRAVLAAIDAAKEADRQAQAEAQAAALKRAQDAN